MLEKLQKSVGDVLDFPPDVVGEGPKITITGRGQVLVENFLSILTFTEEEIRLETAAGEICFTGQTLMLTTILPTELRIEGILSSLTFGGGERK